MTNARVFVRTSSSERRSVHVMTLTVTTAQGIRDRNKVIEDKFGRFIALSPVGRRRRSERYDRADILPS